MTKAEIDYVIESITKKQSSYNKINSFSGMTSSYVDELLDESSLATDFDFNGYETDEQKHRVLGKLVELWSLLLKKGVPSSDESTIYVVNCLKLVNTGYALTKETITKLNEIHQRHA
jgi:hypothetical protein